MNIHIISIAIEIVIINNTIILYITIEQVIIDIVFILYIPVEILHINNEWGHYILIIKKNIII